VTWLWWAPLVAATLHIFEEFVWPGGFADWDRAYRPEIAPSITKRLHVIVNAALLFLCLSVAVGGMPGGVATWGAVRMRSIPAAWAPAAWIGLAALLASNAIFHLVGAIRTRRYSPGLVTGLALYLPLAAFGDVYFLSTGRASPGAAALATLIGGSYHLWAAFAHRWRAGTPGAAPAS
jgi:hypothetical protein